MPASQHFDERHLQDVVLAQSGQIRPARRFSGLEVLTRPVVALTAIVAIVAIALGVKDYVQLPPAASTGTPAIEDSKTVTGPTKKVSSAKSKARRRSATEASAGETGQAAADAVEKPLIKWDSAKDRTRATATLEDGPNTLRAAAGGDEAEAGTRPDNGADTEGGAISKRGSSECLPLPNGTRPEDVDAPYYFGWATEYCGHDLSRSPSRSKVPQSSKK